YASTSRSSDENGSPCSPLRYVNGATYDAVRRSPVASPAGDTAAALLPRGSSGARRPDRRSSGTAGRGVVAMVGCPARLRPILRAAPTVDSESTPRSMACRRHGREADTVQWRTRPPPAWAVAGRVVSAGPRAACTPVAERTLPAKRTADRKLLGSRR